MTLEIRHRRVPLTSKVWDHDWRALVRDRLRDIGFPSILAYVRSNETSSYALLADELGQGMLAPIQIQTLLQEETVGTPEFGYFIRTSLVRNLNQHLPHGFRMHGEWPQILALSSWAGSMGSDLQAKCGRVAKRIRLRKDIADDWLPASVMDSILEEEFLREEL